MLRLIAALLIALPVTAHDETKVKTLCKFAPENDYQIPVGFVNSNGMTEEDFNSILDRVEKHYRPILEAKGKKLRLQRAWEDSTVNAYAQQWGSTWIVKMFGGLARHKDVTHDGFALVACHEFGHHLAGTPRSSSWASNEGQSDYYATSKCARRIWEEDDNITIMEERLAAGQVSEFAKEACVSVHQTPEERALCLRIAMGGHSLGTTLADLGKNPKPSFETPDDSVVSTTNNRHPKGQCRLDTYFQGSLCEISYTEEFDSRDQEIGACTRAKGHTVGIRPLCWFKPKKS